MKREELLSLASEIFDYEFRENTPQFARIEQFAKRIAEHEREECAKLCDMEEDRVDALHEELACESTYMAGKAVGANKCAKLIRARRE